MKLSHDHCIRISLFRIHFHCKREEWKTSQWLEILETLNQSWKWNFPIVPIGPRESTIVNILFRLRSVWGGSTFQGGTVFCSNLDETEKKELPISFPLLIGIGYFLYLHASPLRFPEFIVFLYLVIFLFGLWRFIQNSFNTEGNILFKIWATVEIGYCGKKKVRFPAWRKEAVHRSDK